VVVLVAPPGVDLGTVATRLGARLGLAVRDTDALVAAQAGQSVADLVLVGGDDALRRWQEQVVVTALRDGPGVVAVGSGAVEVAAVRSALAEVVAVDGVVVLLDLPSDAAARIVLGPGAVPGLGPVRATWRQMYDQRHALLEQVATVTVPVGGAAPDEIVAATVAALAGRVWSS
jgi:shikimate kinase